MNSNIAHVDYFTPQVHIPIKEGTTKVNVVSYIDTIKGEFSSY